MNKIAIKFVWNNGEIGETVSEVYDWQETHKMLIGIARMITMLRDNYGDLASYQVRVIDAN